MLVVHYTGMETSQAACGWMCDPRSQVSAHYLIDEAGTVFSLVAEDRRAWHAGVSFWAGEDDINSVSIGIEVHNRGHAGGLPPYGEAQIDTLIDLARAICERHAIPASRVLAHSDVAPGRKCDPGEHFPWDRLARAGIGLWVEPNAPDEDIACARGAEGREVLDVQRALAELGYGLQQTGCFDDASEAVVAAFQRHWRPARVDGRVDRSTRHALERIGALAHAR